MHLWSNEFAGPDGGDGGNGGHVIFESSYDVKDLSNVPTVVNAAEGEKGQGSDCHGKNANNFVITVPVGTVIKNMNGTVIGDLCSEGLMFIAARGGAGGKGNHFFVNDVEQAPKICEYGAAGESLQYWLEVKSMAHVGLVSRFIQYNFDNPNRFAPSTLRFIKISGYLEACKNNIFVHILRMKLYSC